MAPSLEKKRAARAATAAAKRKRAAERQRAKEVEYYTVAGVDLRKEMARLLRVGRLRGLARRPPTIQVRRTTSQPRRYGVAWPEENRIQITEYPGIDAADVRETLTHELVHILIGYRRNDGAWHGDEFRQTMREVFRDAYGVSPRGIETNVYHGRYARALREKEAS